MISQPPSAASSFAKALASCRRFVWSRRLLDYLLELASARGVSLSSLVNALLRKAYQLIEEVVPYLHATLHGVCFRYFGWEREPREHSPVFPDKWSAPL